MSKKYIALLLTIAFSGAAVFAGCGGSDSSDSEAPTKAEFITQADEICQKYADQITEDTAGFDDKTSNEEVLSFAEDTYVPTLQDEVAELRDLTPPEGEEDSVESLWTSLEDGVNEIADDPEIVISGKSNPLEEASAQAKEFGLTVCGAS